MQSTDKRAGVIFSDLMESLFENIAKAIEIHQPLIETKYGKLLHIIYSASHMTR